MRIHYGMTSFTLFYFFLAEDGIRDLYVTGVQTCALPICLFTPRSLARAKEELVMKSKRVRAIAIAMALVSGLGGSAMSRSEERRVGKECGSRWWARC